MVGAVTAQRSAACFVVLGALALHGWLCWRAYPPGRPTDPIPFLQNDHTFHFYYAWLAARAGTPNPSAYDPFFMAGYAKTLLFPTSSTYPELIGWLFPEVVGLAYRLYVLFAAWLTAGVLAAAAGVLGSGRATAIAAIVGVGWFWGAFPVTYMDWGMTAFVVTTALSIFGAVCLVRVLERGARGQVGWWVLGTLVLCIAQVGHPSTAVTTGSILAGPLLASLRTNRWHRTLLPLSTAAIVLLVWSPWWWPTYAARGELRSLGTGFINANFTGRMLEIVSARFPAESALLLAGLAVWTGGFAPRGVAGWAAAGGTTLLFLLGYVAAAIPQFAWLQPGRYTQPLYGWLVVWVSAAVVNRDVQSSSGLRRPVAYVLLACAAALLVWAFLGQVPMLGQPRLHNRLPWPVAALCRFLRQQPVVAGRVLFEELERRAEVLPRLRPPADPYGGTNAAALVAARTGKVFIGGPYLYTHLKANYVQCGDGFLLGRKLEQWEPEAFWAAIDRYNVRWVVAWSRPLLELVESRSGRARRVLELGSVRVYEVFGASNWAVRGYARCEPDVNRLRITDARGDATGWLVLSFHWVPGLSSSHVELVPVRVGQDPVPFIGVRQPPGAFEIEWAD